MTLRVCSAIAVIATATTLTACVSVPAWDRAKLAHPCMAPEPRPMSAGFAEHVFDYREGSAGGSGIVGGGCGCN
jgi:hypothetical protein